MYLQCKNTTNTTIIKTRNKKIHNRKDLHPQHHKMYLNLELFNFEFFWVFSVKLRQVDVLRFDVY